jgi:hypothetical protein
MIALLDTSTDLKICEEELGVVTNQLLTPLTRFNLQYPDARFAVDNGAYARFDSKAFFSLLERERERKSQCIFVTVPDVVGSAIRTMELFDYYTGTAIKQLKGWPLALAAQDGIENIGIPWKKFSAVFIGGTTEWKMSAHSIAVIKCAKAIGKWVHVGRVNTVERFNFCLKHDVDSIDGTGIAKYSHMRLKIKNREGPNSKLNFYDIE